MAEQLKGVTVEMGARTTAEASDDLEAITAALRSVQGGALSSRLMFWPRALTVSVRTES